MKACWMWFVIIVSVSLSLSCALMAAGTPYSEKEIPLYPGVVRDKSVEEELYSQQSEYAEEIQDTWRSNTIRVYKVEAVINDVCKFYLDKLAPEPGVPIDDPSYLEPGEVYPPWYEVEYYEPSIFENQYDQRNKLFYDGKWVKSVFDKRNKWKDGKWIRSAWIEWNTTLDNGDMAQYSICIEDEGYDAGKKVIFNTTRITIQILIIKSEEAWEEEEDWELDELTAEKAEQLEENPPTEETLGIPIYPGSIFDPRTSAGMSLDDYAYYVFFCNDSPAKVVAYYEKKLGKKASSNDGGYLFALKGKPPIPEEGLVIQPNMIFGGDAKTIITVQKQN